MSNRTDNFNRGDNASLLGPPSDGGSAWVVDAVNGLSGGTFGINGNQAYVPFLAAPAAVTLESSVADATVRATIAVTSSRSLGLAFRSDANGNYWVLRGSGNIWVLEKIVAGTGTVIATSPASYPNLDGDIISVVLSGTSIIAKVNGSAITNLSITDATYQTQTKHGLAYASGDATMRWDDFSVTVTVGAATKLGIQGHALGSASGLATSNKAFDFQPVILIQDVTGATVATDNTTVVTASVTSGTGTLIGTVTKTATAGVADFGANTQAGPVDSTWYVCNFLGINGIGTNTITYSAVAAGLTAVVETPITTTAGVFEGAVAASGTVACTAGAATFTASQATALTNNQYVVHPNGTQYRVSAFNGTTGCTLASTTGAAGTPTFSATAFTIANVAELPRAAPTRTQLTIDGTTYLETAATLQARINSVQAAGGNLNHKIRIRDGEIVTAQVTCPQRASAGTGWLQIESETLPCAFGTTVRPANFTTQARWETQDGQSIIDLQAAQANVRLVGLHIKVPPANPSSLVYELLRIGHSDTMTLLSQPPSGIKIERCWLHGKVGTGQLARAIANHGADVAIFNNWFQDIAMFGGQESQCIAMGAGPGPYLIENNYLESAGENILTGGGDPHIYQLMPADLTIRFNHLNCPRSYQFSTAEHKNLTEFKIGRRALFEGNVYENSFVPHQDGTAILINSIDQEGTAPWSGSYDITVRKNFCRNAEAFLSSAAGTGYTRNARTARIVVHDNVAPNISIEPNPAFIGPQRFFLLVGDDLFVRHNTLLQGVNPTRVATLGAANDSIRLVFRDNIVSGNYGLPGSGTTNASSLNQASPGTAVFDHNVLIFYAGNDASAQATFAANGYAPNSFIPDNSTLGLTNGGITSTWDAADPDVVCAALALASGSYRAGQASQASDGLDVGANLTAVRSAITGVWQSGLPPTLIPASTGTAAWWFGGHTKL